MNLLQDQQPSSTKTGSNTQEERKLTVNDREELQVDSEDLPDDDDDEDDYNDDVD